MQVIDWGLRDYKEAVQAQLELVEQVSQGSQEESLIFCSHPPVVTLGRASTDSDIMGWSGEVVEVSRGGRATYHGPEQIVVYPIINLSADRRGFPTRDIHAYLRALEAGIIDSFNTIDIPAEIRETEIFDSEGKKLNQTGVWVGSKKVASIGIAVKKWVTYHGLAINWGKDPLAFQGINPCGFNQQTMTSVEELTENKVDKKSFICQLADNLTNHLS